MDPTKMLTFDYRTEYTIVANGGGYRRVVRYERTSVIRGTVMHKFFSIENDEKYNIELEDSRIMVGMDPKVLTIYTP